MIYLSLSQSKRVYGSRRLTIQLNQGYDSVALEEKLSRLKG